MNTISIAFFIILRLIISVGHAQRTIYAPENSLCPLQFDLLLSKLERKEELQSILRKWQQGDQLLIDYYQMEFNVIQYFEEAFKRGDSFWGCQIFEYTSDPEWERIYSEKIKKSVAEAIDKSALVTAQDILGEGEGAFDPDPLYYDNYFNCSTFLQWTMAKAFSEKFGNVFFINSLVCYVGGHVSFQTRKHYWEDYEFDLVPVLIPKNSSMCNPRGSQFVTIDAEKLRQYRKFNLPLINEDRLSMQRSYLDGVDQLNVCLNNLQNGVYYLLPLANSKYLFYYGSKVGRMGAVHGFVVEKNGSDITLSHATYFASKLKKITLKNFLDSRSPSVYQGYFIYKLNPHWSPIGATLLDYAQKKYF